MELRFSLFWVIFALIQCMSPGLRVLEENLRVGSSRELADFPFSALGIYLGLGESSL